MQICLTLFVVSLVPYWHAQDFTAGLIIAALNGLGLAGLMILIDVMLADVIDLDELRTGYRREGMYFGMNALIIRLGISLQGPILGYILATSGYVPEALTQTASAINGLKVAMVIVPIVSLFLSFIMFSFYPLNKQEVREIKEKLKSISF
jgi:GPH family glycoside/pentoside/hexuronide:cation symporter